MKIGLTRTENPEKHQYYKEWLKGEDQDLEIVSLSPDEMIPNHRLDLDGLVLSGGTDIHPEFYGGSLDYPNASDIKWNKDRDSFEKSLFESALHQNLPVLGICRGLQLINISLNGTLIQDLGNELNSIHKGNPDKKHAVHIQQGTILSDIAGNVKSEINSAHHQAIAKLGEGLVINCKSEDGVVEGIEWKDPVDKSFLLAVQWHPERMFIFNLEYSPLSKNIRDRFLEEIDKQLVIKK